MGETVEKAMSAPKRRNTIIGGTIHHNLFFHKYEARSLIILEMLSHLPCTAEGISSS